MIPVMLQTRPLWHRGLLVGLLLLGVVPLTAQEPAGQKPPSSDPPVDGIFITVRNPLDSVALKRIKAQTDHFLDRPDRRGVKIIYDFNADGAASHTDDYGVCRDLAEYLLGLQDVTTVAFVHNDVTGHTVLPVLACKEVVMAKKSRIGNVPGKQAIRLEADKLLFYQHLAERRRYFPAIVLKMADRDMEVIEGTRGAGPWYIDARNKDDEVKNGFIAAERRDPALGSGKAALYDAAQAVKYGLCRLELETRNDVKDAYRLPTSSLRENPLQGRSPNAWRITVSGKIDAALKERLQRRLNRSIAKGANLIFLQLECGDGDATVARELADFCRTLRDDRDEYPVMTVAVVTESARNTAVFLAMGCTEIVMEQKSQLGGFEPYLHKRLQFAPAISKSLEELAEKQGYSSLLARGMLDPNLTIHSVSRKGKAFEKRLMDGNELNEDVRVKEEWVNEGVVKPFGVWLTLDSREAKRLDVAKHVFDGESRQLAGWLRDQYGLEERQPHDVGTDWLEDLAEFLCSPVVSVFLVMIGITGLILELKVPGVGVPGVVAAICFVLYFWAHSQLAGHLSMLAVLLFLLGLVLLALEIFLVPGLGIPGISGIILVIVSLGLATLVKKPETQHEWIEFGTTLTTISLSLIGAIAGAFALAYYLPHIPWANRLVLVPPADPSAPYETEVAEPSPYAGLLGAIGEAATTLRPAGKARFGDEFIDVVAEGNYVQPGSRVQVIEIEGNRIVVKAV
jgi:membrane-bound ClpP family serine protease